MLKEPYIYIYICMYTHQHCLAEVRPEESSINCQKEAYIMLKEPYIYIYICMYTHQHCLAEVRPEESSINCQKRPIYRQKSPIYCPTDPV